MPDDSGLLASIAMLHAIVTCGPSYEPIDEVRRITNFSTGELGELLTNRLTRAGFAVTCLGGVAAPRTWSLEGAEYVPFTTNDDLQAKLTALSERAEVAAVFHAAALADFRVGRTGDERKLSSRAGALTLTLIPAAKLIGQLRELFPRAWIVGWKYELDGTAELAIAKARRQLAENHTDLSIVNGAAYGEGFGIVRSAGPLDHLADKSALVDYLTATLVQRHTS